jgi:hypothetical protein
LTPSDRAYAWEFTQQTGDGPGTAIAFCEIAPADQLFEVEAADVFHNGAVATDLAIGLFQSGRVVLFVSSATDAARPLAGVPVVLPRGVRVPPLWQLIAAANTLGAGESVTIRVMFRRKAL